MTLSDIEEKYQVPSAFLIARLNLPTDTSSREPLKELKDKHHFEMETVRILVEKYRAGKVEHSDEGDQSSNWETQQPKGRTADFSSAGILALYGGLGIGMLVLLRKNLVNQSVRLVVLSTAVLIFGILFKAQLEPVRGLVQVFQALVMSRFGLLETVPVLVAFIAMALIGSKLVCGWGCPVGALMELLYHIPVFSKLKKKRAPFWASNCIRIILFIIFLIFLFGLLPGLTDQSIYRFFNPFKLFEWNFRMTAPIIVALIFVLSVIQYRAYCMWICPFGLFSWLIQKLALFHVHVNPAACIDCGKCVRACPTNAVKGVCKGKKLNADCFSCGRCLQACLNGALAYRVPLNDFRKDGNF